MKVTVEKIEKPVSGLERCLKIVIPAEQVSEEKAKKYKELSENAQLPGYRKGKVPLSMLEKRYGEAVNGELKHDLVNKSLQDAFSQEKLTPVNMPELAPLELEDGKPFEIKATFEVAPEVKLVPMTELALERFKAEITAADVDEALEKLRERHATWNKVETPAKSGDQLKIDYVGTIKKEAFPGGSADGMLLKLGENKMIEGFEDKLIGATAGQEVTFDIKFPKDYQLEEIAGKKARFVVKVHEVSVSTLPDLDDNFAKKLDISDGLEKLREQMKKSMQQELDRITEENLKYQIAEQLNKLHPIPLPNVLVDAEIKKMQQQIQQRMASMSKDGSMPEVSSEHLEKQARQKVALGMIFAELISHYKITLDQARLQKKIEDMASMFGTNQQSFMDWFSKDEASRREMGMSIMEEQVVEKILEEAKEKTKDKAISYSEAIAWRPPEAEEQKGKPKKKKK